MPLTKADGQRQRNAHYSPIGRVTRSGSAFGELASLVLGGWSANRKRRSRRLEREQRSARPHLLQPDFWLGITSGLPVTREQSRGTSTNQICRISVHPAAGMASQALAFLREAVIGKGCRSFPRRTIRISTRPGGRRAWRGEPECILPL